MAVYKAYRAVVQDEAQDKGTLLQFKNVNASEIKRGMGGLHGNKVCDAHGLCYGFYLIEVNSPTMFAVCKRT
jgi:hypothetical protein